MTCERNHLELNKVVRVERLECEDPGLTRELQALAREARDYVTSFKWCRSVKATYAAIAIPGVVGVFLFQIDPAGPDVDACTWVIVGDLPPAYITPEVARNPVEALEAYIAEMDAWVEAVRGGRSVADLIPVNIPSETRFAEMLATRLGLLREEVVAKRVGVLVP